MAVSSSVFPAALLAGCQRHEPAAQAALYRHFAPRVLGICRRYARAGAQADDWLQETFLRVFQRLDQFRGEGPFEAWVRRVAVTTCLDHYRAEAGRWRDQPLEAAGDLTTDAADALAHLGQQELLRLIERLPDGYRVVLNLYCIEGYSHKEIGQQLGIDEKTSSSQLFKARRLLAEWVRHAALIASPTDDFA